MNEGPEKEQAASSEVASVDALPHVLTKHGHDEAVPNVVGKDDAPGVQSGADEDLLRAARGRCMAAYECWSTVDEYDVALCDLQRVAEAELQDLAGFDPRFAMFLSHQLEVGGDYELSSQCLLHLLRNFESVYERLVDFEQDTWNLIALGTISHLKLPLEQVLAMPGKLPQQCLAELLRYLNVAIKPPLPKLPPGWGYCWARRACSNNDDHPEERAHLVLFLADALCAHYHHRRLFDHGVQVQVGASSLEYILEGPTPCDTEKEPDCLQEEHTKLLQSAANAVEQVQDVLHTLQEDTLWRVVHTRECLDDNFFRHLFYNKKISKNLRLFHEARNCYEELTETLNS